MSCYRDSDLCVRCDGYKGPAAYFRHLPRCTCEDERDRKERLARGDLKPQAAR